MMHYITPAGHHKAPAKCHNTPGMHATTTCMQFPQNRTATGTQVAISLCIHPLQHHHHKSVPHVVHDRTVNTQCWGCTTTQQWCRAANKLYTSHAQTAGGATNKQQRMLLHHKHATLITSTDIQPQWSNLFQNTAAASAASL